MRYCSFKGLNLSVRGKKFLANSQGCTGLSYLLEAFTVRLERFVGPENEGLARALLLLLGHQLIPIDLSPSQALSRRQILQSHVELVR